MAIAGETLSSPNPVIARWLWLVRAAAIISLLLFVVFAIGAYFPRGQCSPTSTELVMFAFYTSPYWSPCLYVLWRIRRGADKRGLVWAMDWGALFSVLTAVLLVSDAQDAHHVFLIGTGSLAVCDALMAASAVKVYRTRLADDPNWPTAPRGYIPVVAYVILGILAMLAVPLYSNTRGGANQTLAVRSLRLINAAEVSYAKIYRTGFSPNLAVLQYVGPDGPTSETQLGMIDPVLASGRRRGYTFVYSPGPKNQAGQIESYLVVARPLDSTCGDHSYLTDESGVIRQSQENCTVTAKDPPIPK